MAKTRAYDDATAAFVQEILKARMTGKPDPKRPKGIRRRAVNAYLRELREDIQVRVSFAEETRIAWDGDDPSKQWMRPD